MARYEELAKDIRNQIANSTWRSGEKIPSVRASCKSYGYSIATVLQAYQLLESEGWLIAKPQSGYFVAPQIEHLKSAQLASSPVDKTESKTVEINDILFDVLQRNIDPSLVPLSSAFPEPSLFPLQTLARSLSSASRQMSEDSAIVNLPPGSESLRRQIAQRYIKRGVVVNPDHIVITAGALEALNLSLQVLTSPGDTVVIESPAFYGALQAIERLNLRAVEVKTDPVHGVDLNDLADIVKRMDVKACWFMTNFQNPLGFCMSDDNKRKMMTLLAKHQVALIEDDVYSELYFGDTQPKPAQAFDDSGNVFLCGSFSKCLSPGYRVGWVVSERHSDKIQRTQLMSTLSSSVPTQLGLTHYLQYGGYDNHLRKLRKSLHERKVKMRLAIQQYFPQGTLVTDPNGGYFLWIEMTNGASGQSIYEAALTKGIAIAPGILFGTQEKFSHHIRINCSYDCEERVLASVQVLGELASC